MHFDSRRFARAIAALAGALWTSCRFDPVAAFNEMCSGILRSSTQTSQAWNAVLMGMTRRRTRVRFRAPHCALSTRMRVMRSTLVWAAPGWVWSGAQRSTLVLGPPRAGKTSSLVIPNILLARGAVVSTSTKPDVMEATADARGSRRLDIPLRPERRDRMSAWRRTRRMVAFDVGVEMGCRGRHGGRDGPCEPHGWRTRG